jgi:signal transduction histidine kinase
MNNLLGNAIKFTASGSITVDAIREGETSVRLTVRDTGAGIAPRDQDLIFQPFRQTKQGVQQGSGTGLGLPISRSLAEAHGGKLILESKLGEGSAFHVILPVKATTSAS